MLRWALAPALLLASVFLLPPAADSATPGSGFVVTAQPAGQKLAIVAFTPFCVVLRIGNTAYGMTTSYALRRVALAEPATTTSPQPLILNAHGNEDVKVSVSYDSSASPRARLFRVPMAVGDPTS
jgi:hypothetical protein